MQLQVKVMICWPVACEGKARTAIVHRQKVAAQGATRGGMKWAQQSRLVSKSLSRPASGNSADRSSNTHMSARVGGWSF